MKKLLLWNKLQLGQFQHQLTNIWLYELETLWRNWFFFSKTGELCHISIYEQQNYQTPNNPTKGKSKPTSIQTDKIGQQPENCENCNDPDLVQAFLKKWWVESDFKAPIPPLSLRLKVSSCHYNSIHNNTRTKQVKQLSKQCQTQWSKCQRHFYVTHW